MNETNECIQKIIRSVSFKILNKTTQKKKSIKIKTKEKKICYNDKYGDM